MPDSGRQAKRVHSSDYVFQRWLLQAALDAWEPPPAVLERMAALDIALLDETYLILQSAGNDMFRQAIVVTEAIRRARGDA